jgi:predicted transcriptional regulator
MLFLSIHPEYVQAIVKGSKTVELRKRRPKVGLGSTVVIYATMPQCEIVAKATLARVQSGTPQQLWTVVKNYSAVTKSTFLEYFAESELAVAIHLKDICVFKEPLKLSDLRRCWQGFHPPQQFRYLDPNQQKFIAKQPSQSVKQVSR